MLAAGYLVEADGVGDLMARPGRPVVPLRVVAEREFVIGVKLAGDHVVGVVVDLLANVRATREARLDSHQVERRDRRAGRADRRPAGGRRRTGQPGRRRASAGTSTPPTAWCGTRPFLEWRDVPLADAAVGPDRAAGGDRERRELADRRRAVVRRQESASRPSPWSPSAPASAAGFVVDGPSYTARTGWPANSATCRSSSTGRRAAAATRAASRRSPPTGRSCDRGPRRHRRPGSRHHRGGRAGPGRSIGRPPPRSPSPARRSGAPWPSWRTCSTPTASCCPARVSPPATCSRAWPGSRSPGTPSVRRSSANWSPARCPDHTWARGAAAVAIQHLFLGPITGVPMR